MMFVKMAQYSLNRFALVYGMRGLATIFLARLINHDGTWKYTNDSGCC